VLLKPKAAEPESSLNCDRLRADISEVLPSDVDVLRGEVKPPKFVPLLAYDEAWDDAGANRSRDISRIT